MRIAFLGGGMMAQVAHIPFYVTDRRCTVAAISESRPSLVAALGEQYKLPVIPNHQAVIDDPSVDAVVIAAPRQSAGPLAMMALEAGKHVVTEKPMAHTLEQGQRLVGAAAARGRHYLIGFMKRYDPGVVVAKAALDELKISGAFGHLLAARFYNYTDKQSAGPGQHMPSHTRPTESRPIRFPAWPLSPDWLAEALAPSYAWYLNVVSHDINLMRFLLGDGMTPLAAFRPDEHTVIAQLALDDTVVTIEAVRSSPGRWMEGAEVIFEGGRVAFELPWPMDRAGVTRVVRQSRDGNLETLASPAGWAFERQAQAFIATLNSDNQSRTDGADCLGDLALIEDLWKLLNF